MTRISLIAIAAVFAVACGPDFAGAFSGTMTQNGVCTDGSSANGAFNTIWTVSMAGGAATITSSGTCSPMTGNAAGDTITLQGKSCSPYGAGGWTYSESIKDGTARLNGNTLSIAIHSSVFATNTAGGTGTCPLTYQANLVRP